MKYIGCRQYAKNTDQHYQYVKYLWAQPRNTPNIRKVFKDNL